MAQLAYIDNFTKFSHTKKINFIDYLVNKSCKLLKITNVGFEYHLGNNIHFQ